ncbi:MULTISPECIES: IS3 family transposase [Staphylococcaceae]|uniref:IS3 family transposase n=1 Tax=Staphylococcaceae TaxID=90964 RepID=UPI00289C3913|nr:IS3 family transposase [Mammaliicoccus sciuri]
MDYGFNASEIFTILNLNPSTYYHRIARRGLERSYGGGRPIPGYSFNTMGQKVFDGQIEEYIMELIEGEAFGYGYYKIHIILERKFNLIVNHKKVYRLCKSLGILKPQRQRKVKYPRRIARNREITASNQLWEVDIKYGYITGEDKFFYILSYLDVFDRDIVDYHIGLNCTGKDAVFTLKTALKRRNIEPKNSDLVVRSDNGPQFISNAFEGACNDLDIEHERIPVNTPNKNAHIEAFHRILEDDCLSINEFETYTQAYMAIVDYMDFYSNIRIHSSIKYLPPAEYYLGVIAGNIKPSIVRV